MTRSSLMDDRVDDVMESCVFGGVDSCVRDGVVEVLDGAEYMMTNLNGWKLNLRHHKHNIPKFQFAVGI